MANKYLFGKGKLFFAQRDSNGKPGALYWPGNVASLELSIETEEYTHRESYSGNNLQDLAITYGKSASFSARVESFALDTLALGLYGSKIPVAGSTVSAETLPDSLVANDEVFLANGNVSSLVLTDSATPTPATLTLNTNYTIEDAATGRIKLVNVAGFTQPFKAAYSYAARNDLGVFTTAAPERWVRYEGINLANNNKRVVVDIFRAKVNPQSGLPLISESEAGGYDLTGQILADDKRSLSDPLGVYFRIIDLE